jgi:hypothetical protein
MYQRFTWGKYCRPVPVPAPAPAPSPAFTFTLTLVLAPAFTLALTLALASTLYRTQSPPTHSTNPRMRLAGGAIHLIPEPFDVVQRVADEDGIRSEGSEDRAEEVCPAGFFDFAI